MLGPVARLCILQARDAAVHTSCTIAVTGTDVNSKHALQCDVLVVITSNFHMTSAIPALCVGLYVSSLAVSNKPICLHL